MKPLILLSNDDGVYAEGIRTLAAALSSIADVVVVAPLHEQSAKSHALTLAHPLRHRIIGGFHAIDGTPADAIYVGLFRRELLPRTPDLVVSGINHGYNLGSDTFYSGTVAAAREGALRNIPSIAFSLGSSDLGFDFDVCAPIAVGIVERLLAAPKSVRTPLLNVNFPARGNRQQGPARGNRQQGPAREEQGPAREEQGPAREEQGPAREEQGPAREEHGPAREEQGPAREERQQGQDGTPNGIRATRLGVRRYEDEVDVRRDPRGRDYYWIGGPNYFHDVGEGTDTEAVDAGYVSITPLGLNATEQDHMALANLAAGVPPS